MGVVYSGCDMAVSNVNRTVERYAGIGEATVGELEEPTPEALKYM